MQLVNIHDAKTRLSKLLEQVQSGEDVVIARAGTPIARLIPYAALRREIAPPGGMQGEIWIADDFDAPIDDLFDVLKPEAR
ncbi:MAG: type II toxin-antitoxin system Phd/YefM family antitoxin [Sulfuritalea sp.]|jgi:prevent-host-death family protein|nr:type II toxin-antitoxin system Phd/YefM family antitoxin [Sulfuritalea sp.]